MGHPPESLTWQAFNQADIACLIGHARLKPDAAYEYIQKACEVTKEYA